MAIHTNIRHNFNETSATVGPVYENWHDTSATTWPKMQTSTSSRGKNKTQNDQNEKQQGKQQQTKTQNGQKRKEEKKKKKTRRCQIGSRQHRGGAHLPLGQGPGGCGQAGPHGGGLRDLRPWARLHRGTGKTRYGRRAVHVLFCVKPEYNDNTKRQRQSIA